MTGAKNGTLALATVWKITPTVSVQNACGNVLNCRTNLQAVIIDHRVQASNSSTQNCLCTSVWTSWTL